MRIQVDNFKAVLFVVLLLLLVAVLLSEPVETPAPPSTRDVIRQTEACFEKGQRAILANNKIECRN